MYVYSPLGCAGEVSPFRAALPVAPMLPVIHLSTGWKQGMARMGGIQPGLSALLDCWRSVWSRHPSVDLMQDNHGNSVHLGIFFMGIFVRNRIGRQAVIYR